VSAAASLPLFPDIVWSAPALRGLDARARREIEAAGTLMDRKPNERIYAPGDPADALYVVIEGAVSVRANAAEIRRAVAGETFGEEAIVRLAGSRLTQALSTARARIAVIPAAVMRRAAERAGRDEVAERRMRAMRRAAVSDMLSMLGLADDFVLDAARPMEAPRGTIVMRAGDRAEHVYIVADGMLQLQEEDGRGIAFVARGDFVGDEDAIRHARTAVAIGPSFVLRVPRAAFSKLRIEKTEKRIAAEAPVDLYRLDVARSLLVIDQEACVRCGHCAASCADTHSDGIARLIRRGEKVRLRVLGETKSLLVPTSCQHCSNPACLVDCPTGAIARNKSGEVVIREDLCTGCGNCAKACPWDNIQMAEKGERTIAAKCDLCSARPSGPACVAACPTSAIARIDPAAVLDVVRALPHDRREPLRTTSTEPTKPAWPWLVGALAIAASAALFRTSVLASGILAGSGMLALASYGAIKRLHRRVRPHFVAHLAIGLVTTGFVISHVHRVASNIAGALVLAFAVTALTGIFGAFVYAILPPRLSRLERKGTLPEELAHSGEELFRALSGSSELVKAVYAKVLRPYERAFAGGARLLVSNRSLDREEARLAGEVRAILGEKATPERMRPIDDLARTLVDRRAVGSQRIGHALLRAWLVVHLAFTGSSLVLLVLHAWDAWRFR
jgi:Fe-S-cluster-containing dehydrogenase component